ncbi:MAG: HD domain-containing protein [Candidatus Paceibacterota bacterium]|jgi:putative hydrolase of HD superfamily
MKKLQTKEVDAVVNFLFESGMLAKTPRSGFFFLGSGNQSIAEHLNRVSYIGFSLAQMAGDVDVSKVLQMCMFHDFAEARTSDLNYVHQKYVKSDENKALADLLATLPFGNKIASVVREYEARKTKESLLAKDADNLEFIMSLKEQFDIGNERAKTWIPSAIKRLKTKEGKILGEKIIKIDSDDWWFSDKKNEWWVTRNKK